MSNAEPNRDATHAGDIVAACRELHDVVLGLTEDGFMRSRVHQYAAFHLLTVIGEAAHGLSEEVKAAHPEVPWRLIVGMREVVVQRDHQIDLDVVWHVIQNELPELARRAEHIRQELARSNNHE